MLITLKIANEYFLRSVAGKSLIVAQEAELGRTIFFLAEQVQEGLISEAEARALLRFLSEQLDRIMA